MGDQKVVDVAKEKLAQLNKDKEAKAAEARDAAGDKSAQTQKTKEELAKDEQATKDAQAKQLREKAEAQVKEDKRILETSDDTLKEDEKSRKAELLKIKEDDKRQSTQDKIDKRMGELTGKIKDLERDKESNKEEVVTLKKQLEELKNPKKVEDVKEMAKKAETERLAKYLEEDKDKPKAERREMTDDELNDWLSEDYTTAQRWLTRQEMRRSQDQEQYAVAVEAKKFYANVLEKQKPSIAKTLKSHPELDTNAREKELKDQGKSAEEIQKTIFAENEKVRTTAEVIRDHPEWRMKETGPELIVTEMEKRLKITPNAAKEEKDKTELDELQKKIDDLEEEIKRRDDDDGAITSSRSAETKKDDAPKTDIEKKREELAMKAGISPEKIRKRVADRKAKGLGHWEADKK